MLTATADKIKTYDKEENNDVIVWSDYRMMPKGYRTAVCECMARKFLIFKEELTHFECPVCHTKYYTPGFGGFIQRLEV